MPLLFSFSRNYPAVCIALALIAIQGDWSSARGDVTRPTLHELAVIEAYHGLRRWYHEEEFRRDPLLRAEPHHTVVLDLESARSGRKIRNTIPYRFTETAEYRFCISKEEPHIQSLELRRERSNGVEVHVSRGAGCKTRVIAAGLYQLHIEHDGDAIAAEGVKAFIHIPQPARLQLTSESAFAAPNFMAIKGPNGMFVTDGSGATNAQLVAAGTTVDTHAVWRLVGGPSQYSFKDGNNVDVKSFNTPGNCAITGPLFTQTSSSLIKVPTFTITDQGNWQFTLLGIKIICDTYNAGVFVNQPGTSPVNSLTYWETGGIGSTFTADYKGFDCTNCDSSTLPLQQGEVALFAGCNYTGPAIVFRTDVPDFSVYNAAAGQKLAMGNDMVASVRVGPNTVATIYRDPQYAGQSMTIPADIPCLTGTSVGTAATSSLKIKDESANQLIVATNACEYCVLTGIDLSGLDLTHSNFTGAILNQANLTNTIFQSATLDHAQFASYNGPTFLTGTDFLGASLACVSFQDSDLRNAFFWIPATSGTPAVLPVITKDFSCRVALQYARLKVATFPLNDWRYLLLNNAGITDSQGQVLSSTSQPLDLSRAMMSGTGGLTHVDLTAANLAGANFTGTDLTGANLHKVTTIDPVSGASSPVVLTGAKLDSVALDYAILDGAQLNNASIAKAYLKRVSLKNALLQGANLSSSNLDGANFCAAKLNQSPDKNLSAILDGAFLRNINLSGADLTGASLVNANLYSSAPASAATCNPASCGFSSSCASAVNAHLANADFTDAYVAGVDFSGSFPQSTKFTGATLSGSNFTSANLTQDITSGNRTNFTDTYLQGTIFTTATVTGANFTGAVFDLTHSTGQIIKEQLNPATHLTFPGYTPASGSTLGCVQFTTNRETVVPQTDNSNICPNSGFGPCTTAQWQTIAQPAAPVCNVDFNWIFATY